MASLARAKSPVRWMIQPPSVAGVTFPVARLGVHLHLVTNPALSSTVIEQAWLDTGAPVSVIPFHVHHNSLHWQPVAGLRVTWAGQRCDLGRIDVWLPVDQPRSLHGPLSLLAKFPRTDPPGDPVPVLLGLEFLLAHQAEFHLPLPPQNGSILLP
jgi:hypothetical protein